MNRRTKILSLILSTLIIILSVITITQNVNYPGFVEEKTLDSYFIVSDQGGIGIVPGIVFFGKMTPGGSGTAKIYIKNDYNKPIIAEIEALGEIKSYFIEQKILINTKENKEVSLTVRVPQNVEYGEYRGKISIKIRLIA